MSALDSMLSQYRSNSPNPTASAPTASPMMSGVGGAPNSFFSAVPGPPDSITPGAISKGFSPFGVQNIPDLTNASPQQKQFIIDSLSNLTYSVPAGGYLFSDTANDPNSAYVKGYYGKPMGSQSGADNLARQVYDLIGSFPTRAAGTTALNQLTGSMPGTGPSLNTQVGGKYGGPFAFPGWNMGNNLL